MISICPSCHDAVDRGNLTITDDELYHWKGIQRSPVTQTGSIFVEPALFPHLVLGQVNFMGAENITIIEFEYTKLSLAVREGELAVLNLKTADAEGKPLLDVVDNYVRQRNPGVAVDSRPGRYRVTVDDYSKFYPQWVQDCLAKGDPSKGPSHYGVLDIAVLAPGEVRVQGLLLGGNGAIVADESEILMISRKDMVTIGMVVDGRKSRFCYHGTN